MARGFFTCCEQACAFQHHVYAQIFPRQVDGVADRADGNAVAVHAEGVGIVAYVGSKTPVNTVILEQVSVGFGIAQVINSDHLHLLAIIVLVKSAKRVAANAAKPVNCD